MSEDASRRILIDGAGALAHAGGLEATLRTLLDTVSEALHVGSAAFVAADAVGRLEIVASVGLGKAAVAGLASAIANPGHPIAKTFTDPVPTFDVLPTVPGGPALRSHLPLIVTRDGRDSVVGVLALAYDDPIDPANRPLVEAVADLAAVAVERHRPS